MKGTTQYTEIFKVDTLEAQVEKMVECGAAFDERVAKKVLLRTIASETLMEAYRADPDSVDRFYNVSARLVEEGRSKSVTFEDEDVEQYLSGEHLGLWKSL